jgi:hypothetical protein
MLIMVIKLIVIPVINRERHYGPMKLVNDVILFLIVNILRLVVKMSDRFFLEQWINITFCVKLGKKVRDT